MCLSNTTPTNKYLPTNFICLRSGAAEWEATLEVMPFKSRPDFVVYTSKVRTESRFRYRIFELMPDKTIGEKSYPIRRLHLNWYSTYGVKHGEKVAHLWFEDPDTSKRFFGTAHWSGKRVDKIPKNIADTYEFDWELWGGGVGDSSSLYYWENLSSRFRARELVCGLAVKEGEKFSVSD